MVVVGAGAAGIAAARAARAAGARVTVVSAGEGTAALGSGVVWGVGREPFAEWAEACGLRTGGRYVTVAGWLLAGAAGALASLLDLAALPPDGMLGVVDMPVHPAWSARLVAQTLGARVVRLPEPPAGEGFLQVAAAFDEDGVAEAVAGRLRGAGGADGAGLAGLAGLLFPPVLGLRRADVGPRISRALDLPVGEAAGSAGDPPGVRLGRALRQWLPADVTVLRGTGTVDPRGPCGVTMAGGRLLRAAAVVLATGGLTGGGLAFDGTLRETTAGAQVWTRGRRRVPSGTGAQRGADPMAWFGETPAAGLVTGAGIRTEVGGRVLDADGESALATWLFAAGDVVAARDPDAAPGVADALAAGMAAGMAAARHAQGR